MDKMNFYYGIDLGTTNSVMAESIVTSSGSTKTNVIEINTLNKDGQTCNNAYNKLYMDIKRDEKIQLDYLKAAEILKNDIANN